VICGGEKVAAPLCDKTTKNPVMMEKLKKTDRAYVLSDSSVNEYGFRLLTSGYQIEEYRKNPIGYYMHRRDEGIVVRWDDLCVNGDVITGKPVINLMNGRGEQTWSEVENGFLNAASVGHIVVLEYSMERELMLPGQTGPTITKWYNKECSLVDIPGNCNALTKLYDAQENELNLMDMNIGGHKMKGLPATLPAELCAVLNLAAAASDSEVLAAVKTLSSDYQKLSAENAALNAEMVVLQQQAAAISAARKSLEIDGLLNRALEEKRITTELKAKLAVDYANNPEGLKVLLMAMPAYRAIAEQLRGKSADKTEGEWEWDDYEKKDSTGNKLKDLRSDDPVRYKALFEKKFAA
jgi:hypothetical protein